MGGGDPDQRTNLEGLEMAKVTKLHWTKMRNGGLEASGFQITLSNDFECILRHDKRSTICMSLHHAKEAAVAIYNDMIEMGYGRPF